MSEGALWDQVETLPPDDLRRLAQRIDERLIDLANEALPSTPVQLAEAMAASLAQARRPETMPPWRETAAQVRARLAR
jgi:hypothetical protein